MRCYSELYDAPSFSSAMASECVDGEKIAEVEGPVRLLLERERTALNFLQRLSGVASVARQLRAAVEGTKCRVLDTRKTTPGMRMLQKRAAAAGGATNHRMGLWDAVLIKNNHITAAGGVRAAPRTNALFGACCVEIEVRTREELREALAAGAKQLLLDNLTPAEAADWIREIDGRATVEISGGVTLATVRAYAETGADFVSVGRHHPLGPVHGHQFPPGAAVMNVERLAARISGAACRILRVDRFHHAPGRGAQRWRDRHRQ